MNVRSKIVDAVVFVALSAFAQESLSSSRTLASGAETRERQSTDLRDDIPADLRNSVDSEIRERAFAAATDEADRRFGVVFSPAAWTNRCGKGLIVADLDDTGYAFKYDQNGCVVQSGCDADFEEVVWRQKRRVELRDQFWRDKKIVDSALSNVVARTARTRMRTACLGRRPVLSPRGLLSARRSHLLLEETVPLEEAMRLAQEGKGKGFYQLALRYSRGDGLPRDEQTAYKMLCKARDADYANAVLVEGLCDECDVRDSASSWITGGDARSKMFDYCGTAFNSGRRGHDVLTNEAAFVRVMGKYEKAKRLGALAATNQIAALNKRLADYRDAEVQRRTAEANAQRLAGLLGEGARKPEKEDATARVTVAREPQRTQREARLREEERQAWEAEREERRKQLLDIQSDLKAMREQKQVAAEQEATQEAVKRKADDAAQKEVAEADVSRWRAAFKKIVGFEMGQKIAQEMESGDRSVKLENPYRYFDTARLRYVDGCLYGVWLRFESNDKYTLSSLNAEAKAVSADLARRFGVELSEGRRGLLGRPRLLKEDKSAGNFFASVNTNGWALSVQTTAEGRIWVDLSDATLRESLRRSLDEKREAKKDVLPVFGSTE